MNIKLCLKVLGLVVQCATAIHGYREINRARQGYLSSALPERGILSNDDDDKCPPCFNCMLEMFECKQFSTCNSYTGKCECLPGFGSEDCSEPLCGALSDEDGHRPFRKPQEKCACKDGWGGINCNVCQEDDVCDSFMPEGLKGTCYKDGIIVKSLYQGCDVTNKKILEILKGAKPQVTFSCNRTVADCNFQFWIDEIESFYCKLDTCQFEYDLNKNVSHYTCEDVSCKCIPETMLCGKEGSIDISDFLTEAIKGPGDFSCDLKTKDCRFSEPSMNDLISSVFGDSYIMLQCESGECLHYSQIPGYEPPRKNKLTKFGIFVISITLVNIIGVASLVVFYILKSPLFNQGAIKLSEEDGKEHDFLKSNVKATLTFENISYKVFPTKKVNTTVLNSVSGVARSGEILAIMGGSGAGKTCLLDILAMKNKTGAVSGNIKVNGTSISKGDFAKIVGFVDQEDYLLPTLTVYETVLNSALLRLPRSMSFNAKQRRVYQVLEELRIFDIRDRVIGNDFERGISGGEKRRVSIACELVTSPLILFLDEPTSGLDSNNANNVIECLVRLASHYNRTLVLSIHQPRSNIFKLFDNLVLLSCGEMVYSGDASRVGEFFRNHGYVCPNDYNIADYLIDVTFGTSTQSLQQNFRNNDLEAVGLHSHEDSIHVPELSNSSTQREWEHFAVHRDELRVMLQEPGERRAAEGTLNSHLLQKLFNEGPYFSELCVEIESINSTPAANGLKPSSYESASFFQQLSILNSRTFKNVFRNPKLLMGNYLMTICLGLFLGVLYFDVDNDISGFQNRLGLFFFTLTYFGFLTLTGLSSFALDRIIFLKERSNHYYSPAAYYLSKIISDVFPLRVLPPILLGIMVYPLVGLNMAEGAFFKYICILILFNLGISLEILAIGIIFEDLNNSIIVSVLILLASLLFSGLFINTEKITNVAFRYMKNFSVFYYAYESLIINEVKTLMLREKKYGLNIEIPGATILSTFGFKVQNLLFNIKILAFLNVLFLVLGYLILEFFVVEQK
ncbi:putative ATP-dependent permease ADP1 Ecym_2737 [Eremothecium cymbalariae DBVPG|uniref:ABC transporter domain-containing protein n=1 Tax=Eremothecium cymbalariae (strain CBS 270.75 / DBVPG 7215 / KCTC 17166 / NRRL Y-17582) TaxID=931890 RepID=G8JPH0_ERECY|nr:Hypothetical protein Ecym_2737 [Eremothecium cymbalariae DBVPG\